MAPTAVVDRAGEETEELRRDRPAQRDGPPETRSHSGGGRGMERVTVNLIPRASKALQELAELTGDTKTDIINRALQVYWYLVETAEAGGDVRVREPEDSEARLLPKVLL